MAEETEKKYEKPVFEKQDAMTFTKEIQDIFNPKGRFCAQCSG